MCIIKWLIGQKCKIDLKYKKIDLLYRVDIKLKKNNLIYKNKKTEKNGDVLIFQ